MINTVTGARGELARVNGAVNAWVAQHGGKTQVGAALIVMVGMAYAGVPSFHALCVNVWHLFPTWLKTALVVTWNLYSWLRNPAVRKVADGLLGPGDKLVMQRPVLDADTNTLTAASASVMKAGEPASVVETGR